MIAAVVQFRGQTDHREARHDAVLDVVTQTLFNCGNEVARYGAADDGIDKVELGIVRVVVRTELDLNVAELTMSAGLLLVTAFNVDRLADGLAVRDLGILQHALRAELARQLLRDDLDMHLAQTGQNTLGCLDVLLNLDRRVFFHQTRETGEDLVFFACLLRINRLGNAGGGELQVIEA